MQHLDVFPEIPEMFNQIFRISSINQKCCQWKVGLLAQDFVLLRQVCLLLKGVTSRNFIMEGMEK